MKAADWNTVFEWIVSSWEEVNHSTILNDFRVCFGEDHGILEIEENEMEVNEHSSNIADVPELAELLEKITVIHDKNCEGL